MVRKSARKDILIPCVNFRLWIKFIRTYFEFFSVMGATGAGKSSVRIPEMDEAYHLPICY